MDVDFSLSKVWDSTVFDDRQDLTQVDEQPGNVLDNDGAKLLFFTRASDIREPFYDLSTLPSNTLGHRKMLDPDMSLAKGEIQKYVGSDGPKEKIENTPTTAFSPRPRRPTRKTPLPRSHLRSPPLILHIHTFKVSPRHIHPQLPNVPKRA